MEALWLLEALARLGPDGAACCDWVKVLGDRFDAVLPMLVERPGRASTILGRDGTGMRLTVVEAWDGDGWEAIDPADTSVPPLRPTAADLVVLGPDVAALAAALAPLGGFQVTMGESDGPLHRIGTLQDATGQVSAVRLHLPGGGPGSHRRLLEALPGCRGSTVLMTSAADLPPEAAAMAPLLDLAFVDLAELLARGGVALPPAASTAQRRRAIRPVIRVAPGLTWKAVRLIVRADRSLEVRAPGQRGTHRFPPNTKMGELSAPGILMALAVHGRWSNGPVHSRDHSRRSKAFQRVRRLIESLVPLPGRAFRFAGQDFTPEFSVELHEDLGPGGKRGKPDAVPP